MLGMMIVFTDGETDFNRFDTCDDREKWLDNVDWTGITQIIEINGGYERHFEPVPNGTNVEIVHIIMNATTELNRSITRLHSNLPVETVRAAFDDTDGFMPQLGLDDYSVEPDWMDSFEDTGLPVVRVEIRVGPDGANMMVDTILRKQTVFR